MSTEENKAIVRRFTKEVFPMTNLAIRWSGLLLIVGATLLVAATILSSTPETSQQLPPLANALLFISSILFLLSLPAMYARQANAAGWLGLIGHALLQTGIFLFVVVSAPPLLYSSFDLPFESSLTGFLLGVALTLGLLLTAITTLRAGVFPRWAGILLLAGTAGFFFSFFIVTLVPRVGGQVVGTIMGILLGLALSWIGLSMWTSPRESTR
jgi:hypothetical protein